MNLSKSQINAVIGCLQNSLKNKEAMDKAINKVVNMMVTTYNMDEKTAKDIVNKILLSLAKKEE